MTQSQLIDLEIEVKSQIDELEGRIAVLSRLRGDVSFQQSIANQLLSQLRRVASFEELKTEAAGKKEMAASELKEIMKRVGDRKAAGRKLHEAMEKAMSCLFKGLKVTIVGDETVLCCVCCYMVFFVHSLHSSSHSSNKHISTSIPSSSFDPPNTSYTAFVNPLSPSYSGTPSQTAR